MIKLLALTFFILSLTSCGQHIQIDNPELKQIYIDILKADSLKGRYFLIDSIERFENKSIVQSVTTYVIVFPDDLKSGVWTANLFDSLIIISRGKLDTISKADPFTMTPTHYSLSLPYFSKDKKAFLIYYNHFCGNLCAEYSLRLYKKINGKWTFIKSYFSLVS